MASDGRMHGPAGARLARARVAAVAAAAALCAVPASAAAQPSAVPPGGGAPGGRAPAGPGTVAPAATWVHHLHWTSRRVTAGVILRRGTLRRPAEQVREVIIDPRRYHGTIMATHHGAVARRQGTSSVARALHATVAVNGGFFVISGADGYPGAPAGLAVYRGGLASMSAGARAALVLGAGRPRIERLQSAVMVRDGQSWRAVQGINRIPGVIRNCGRPDSVPFRRPRQDVTCTSRSELVLFTPQLGAATPAGPGAQVVLGPRGFVLAAWHGRRTARQVRRGHLVIQGIGAMAGWLRRHAAVGRHLTVTRKLATPGGRRVPLRRGLSIVSGAPMLVRAGRTWIDAAAEGVIDPADRSFNYAWARLRQPRTIAGVGRRGQLLLVTVDGRRPGVSDGATLAEEAALMRSLGAVSALNLDGGGSTAMAVRGVLVNSPSDGAERADGDFVVAVPRQR
jgi:hypothetical protein